MAAGEINLLDIEKGTVTAPAGCGKTHLIADALRRHAHSKPILVLTHTNAGVSALRSRLERASVRPAAYRLATIDGWAMRLISMFPLRSGHHESILTLASPGSDYPKIRSAAAALLRAGHVDDVIQATYSKLIVDEYQDCSRRQHDVIAAAASVLPACVLGDPLQAIFGFGGDSLAHWEKDVCQVFPLIGTLSTPWRWINANSEPLGQWLLDVRNRLLAGDDIDVRSGPPSVAWVHLDGTDDHGKRLKAARVRPPNGRGKVLIIGDSVNPRGQREFASQTPGATTVESVDLKDLVAFAKILDLSKSDALERVAVFAQSVMTNVGAADLLRRVGSLSNRTARRAPSEAERVALRFASNPSYDGVADLLVEIGKEAGVRTHRPAVLRSCLRALQLARVGELSFCDAAVRMREQYRMLGRQIPARAVGSTLLLKGLEAEVAVVLNADSMNAQNLYVAMTRGSQRLTVCSSTPVFRRPRAAG